MHASPTGHTAATGSETALAQAFVGELGQERGLFAVQALDKLIVAIVAALGVIGFVVSGKPYLLERRPGRVWGTQVSIMATWVAWLTWVAFMVVTKTHSAFPLWLYLLPAVGLPLLVPFRAVAWPSEELRRVIFGKALNQRVLVFAVVGTVVPVVLTRSATLVMLANPEGATMAGAAALHQVTVFVFALAVLGMALRSGPES